MAKKQQTQAKAHERALEPQKKRGGKKDLDMGDLVEDDSKKQGKKPVDPTPSDPSEGGGAKPMNPTW